MSKVAAQATGQGIWWPCECHWKACQVSIPWAKSNTMRQSICQPATENTGTWT